MENGPNRTTCSPSTGPKYPPKSPRAPWGLLYHVYCSCIRSNNLDRSFKVMGEIGSPVGPLICIPNMSVIGRMLDILEVKTSLLDPKVCPIPPSDPQNMPQNQHFCSSYLPMFDVLTITMGKHHENNVRPIS